VVVMMLMSVDCACQLHERLRMSDGARFEVLVNDGTFGDCAPGE
jgi:hypothetical protein